MEIPKNLYVNSISETRNGLNVYCTNFENGIKYIRSDLAELTEEDIKFIVDRYSELPIQYGPRLFEEILKQFNEQREKK